MTEIYCPECADLLNRDHCCPCCGWSERVPEHYRITGSGKRRSAAKCGRTTGRKMNSWKKGALV